MTLRLPPKKTRLPTTLSGCCWLYGVMSDLTLKHTHTHTHNQIYSHSAATKAKHSISIITARAVIHSKSRETKLGICKEMFLTLEPVNIILLTAPHIPSSSNEVPSIKAYNPHFPPELLNGRPTAVFALGHECVLLDVKQCCKRILMCLSKPRPAKQHVSRSANTCLEWFLKRHPATNKGVFIPPMGFLMAPMFNLLRKWKQN